MQCHEEAQLPEGGQEGQGPKLRQEALLAPQCSDVSPQLQKGCFVLKKGVPVGITAHPDVPGISLSSPAPLLSTRSRAKGQTLPG